MKKGLLCALAALLCSCGGESVVEPVAGPSSGTAEETTGGTAARAAVAPVIASFDARPSAVAPGGTVVLSWTTQNATAATLGFPTGESVAQPVNGSISLAFERRGLFTFRLTVTGGGETATATTTVNVGDASPNRPPELVLRTTPRAEPGDPNPVITGVDPLTVSFSLCQSSDPDETPASPQAGDTLNWQFHFGDEPSVPFNADGSFNPSFERFCHVEHTYRRPGRYTATVSVTDKHVGDQGGGVRALARRTQQVTIVVGTAGPACNGISTGFEGYAPGTPGDQLGISGVDFGTSIVVPLGLPVGGFSGNALLSPGTSMDITFDREQRGFHFDFLYGGGGITVEGLRSGSVIFSNTFGGTQIVLGLFAGAASGGGGFDALRVSSSGGIAIDNFSTDCR